MVWIKELVECCFICGRLLENVPDEEPDPAECWINLCEPCNDASGNPENYK
jgi:hypothetical protein